MLTLPPHTSHRLQPLDVSFFGPLKCAYNREIDKWMLNNPGQRVTEYDINQIFTPAYMKVATADKAVKGFKSTGIFPFNPDTFMDEDFVASSVTEREQQPQDVSVSQSEGCLNASTSEETSQVVKQTVVVKTLKAFCSRATTEAVKQPVVVKTPRASCSRTMRSKRTSKTVKNWYS